MHGLKFPKSIFYYKLETYTLVSSQIASLLKECGRT